VIALWPICSPSAASLLCVCVAWLGMLHPLAACAIYTPPVLYTTPHLPHLPHLAHGARRLALPPLMAGGARAPLLGSSCSSTEEASPSVAATFAADDPTTPERARASAVQAQAIKTSDDTVLMLASAGTGKTKVCLSQEDARSLHRRSQTSWPYSISAAQF